MQYLLHICFLFLSVLSFSATGAAQPYWQQQTDYTIGVTLNDEDHTLDGYEQIVYTNHSPDTLHEIWFHLWPNAYKNDKTAFSEQLLRNNNTSFYFADESERGYINQLGFTVNNLPAVLEPDSEHIDIAKLLLPLPLPPGMAVEISTPFHVQLPRNRSRGGHEGNTYQITQWYPKPAVYDAQGWHPMPYLDQGEFYSEFGSFDVSITLPENYMVAASGNLQNKEEVAKLKMLGKMDVHRQPNYELWNRDLRLAALRKHQPFTETMPASAPRRKTLRYTLDSVHDFAWFASPVFLVQYDTVQLASHTVDAFTFFNPWDAERWQNSVAYLTSALHFYSDKLGEYPYGIMTAVLGDANKESGGMEYPTITLLEMSDSGKELDATLSHETGHNWLYGILASNERDNGWMDEGVNTYYENRYLAERYPAIQKRGFPFNKLPVTIDSLALLTLEKLHKDQPVSLRSDSFTLVNYSVIMYGKTALWLQQLEQQLGRERFDRCMQAYYEQWKFKHPLPVYFQQSLEQCSGQSLNSQFGQLSRTGSLNAPLQQQLRPTFLFNLTSTAKYHYISISPAAGYNYYDKLMIGGLVHSYSLPLNRFNFLLSPLYATASRSLAGAGRVSFSTFRQRTWLEFALSATRYHTNSYIQPDHSTLYFGVNRFVPSAKLTLYNKDLRSVQRWTFAAKSFLIGEETFGDFTQVTTPSDTFFMAGKANNKRYVNRLSATVSDNRVLYPYEAGITVDQGKSYVRAGFTGTLFFNYTNSGEGISARLFAGKFFYLQQKTLLSKSENDRYLLTMTGPKGYEDYTYSDYFIGRNEYEGGLSQQMMQRDGFFKVGTPLYNNPVGKTDNWLLAVNLSGDIPKEINPLNILPFKLPIQFFADIGTYSDAWHSDNAAGRFLYDAGVKVSILKSAFSMYLPVIYSKVYRDYYQSFYPEKKVARTIAFSFNLNAWQPNKLNRNIPL